MSKFTIGTIVILVVVICGASLFFLPTRGPSVSPLLPIATSTGTSGMPPTASGTTPPTPVVSSQKGVAKGSVVLGPTCPVERIPPDPNCAPKPYQTTIRIQPANPSAPYTTISTDASGVFSATLDPGTYSFQAQSENNSYYPRCTNVQISVTPESSQTITISCDTGIR